MVTTTWNLSYCYVVTTKPRYTVAIVGCDKLGFRLVAVLTNTKLSITVISPAEYLCIVFSLSLYVYDYSITVFFFFIILALFARLFIY